MLLSRRPNDNSRNGFINWYFNSVHFWGENPRGKWLLMVRDKVIMIPSCPTDESISRVIIPLMIDSGRKEPRRIHQGCHINTPWNEGNTRTLEKVQNLRKGRGTDPTDPR